MKAVACLAVALSAAVSLSVAAQQAERPRINPADLPGRQVFAAQCAPCHGAGRGDDGSHSLPGTEALARKYAGALPGELERRSDLPAPLLRLFVRRGAGAMPAFRPSELTDAEIVAIADYLAATAQRSR
ncbi:c-type cytochrome [Alteraurantiacibacter palmitatis]|uniref:C-type cytochrome n=1 Tax=Alteraurantiacibacter palmitatis TaxID=2054628 RepID=A0ABV7E7M5_9SPHN